MPNIVTHFFATILILSKQKIRKHKTENKKLKAQNRKNEFLQNKKESEMIGAVHLGENLDHIIKNIDIHAEYQPILDTETLEIKGYEALARFNLKGLSYAPDYIFSFFLEDMEKMQELEILVKKVQLKHRPENKTLYLNIDPAILTIEENMKYWEEFFSKQEDIVVEIVESSNIKIIHLSNVFIKQLTKCNIPCALDDLFSEGAIFSPLVFIASSIIKIDMQILRTASEEKEYQDFLSDIIEFCQASGKNIVVEGVETERHLEIARLCGSYYIQGHYFKDKYIQSPR